MAPPKKVRVEAPAGDMPPPPPRRRPSESSSGSGGLKFEDDFGDDLESDEWEDEEEQNDDDDDDGDMGRMEDGEGDDASSSDDGDGRAKDERRVAFGEVIVDDPLEDEGPKKVFRAGVDKMEEGEELDYDSRAYEMLHRITPEWPCLSIDVVLDGLGKGRTRFPMSAMVVAGTQADRPDRNKLLVMKWSQLHRTKHDDDDSDEEDSGNSEDLDDDPILEHREIKHDGGVNRVRSMRQHPNIVATWAETGKVHMWDLAGPIATLGTPSAPGSSSSSSVVGASAGPKLLASAIKPTQTFSGHATEGFAMDWSGLVPGRFVSGDCSKFIYLWEPTGASSWDVSKSPFLGHKSSVEDLQWSPTEATVFASCSSDQDIRVWDTRQKARTSALCVRAHNSDVNVISWNTNVSYLVASGADDGSFKVWDLRQFSPDKATGHFKWHQEPITSIEWHPTDGSVIAASSVEQITIWDMSVELDEEDARAGEQSKVDLQGMELPPQLLFVHQGQKDIKEIRWHPQIHDVLVSTALDGFNIFKPAITADE